ncbi:MAG: hypothetical protein K2Q14_01655, partial [Gammaproteobacteria bacterium]|nr:hypothetical protein [Gammaproteobacteria bacterium]
MMRPVLQKQAYIEVQQEEHIQDEDESYRLLADFKELESVIEEVVIAKEEVNSFAPSSAQADTEHLRWYYTPEPDLIGLLKAIVLNELITEKDYNFIIDCLDYSRGYILAKKPKLRVLALEALVYFAKNKRFIHPESLQAVCKIANTYANEENVFPYGVLILAYAKINSQILAQDEQELVLFGLNKFLDQPLRFFSFIAVCLHAKMLIEPKIPFTESQWVMVNAMLCPIFCQEDDELTQLFHLTDRINFKQQNFSNKIIFSKKLSSKSLRAIQKKLVTAHLTEGSLYKIVQQWERLKDGEDNKKILLLKIIHAAICQGQVDFPHNNQFETVFLNIINTAITYDKDINLAPLALNIALLLIKNSELSFNHINKASVATAIAAGREHVLAAIDEHFTFHDKEIIYQNNCVDKIKQLKTDLNMAVQQAAQYTYSLIVDDLIELSSILESAEECLRATARCLKAAEQKKIIPFRIIKPLVRIIADKTEPFPVEAIKNAWATLINVAKNNRKLPETEYQAIRQLIESEENATLNHALQLLGHYSLVDNILLEKRTLNYIIKLLSLNTNNITLINVTFALGSLFTKATYVELTEHKTEIDRIIDSLSLLLRENSKIDGYYDNTMTALDRITNKEYSLTDDIIENLLGTFDFFSDDEHLIKILNIFAQGINCRVRIKNEDIKGLLKSLSSDNKLVVNSAAEFFCKYIKVNESLVFDKDNMIELNHLIKNKENTDKLIKIFRYLAENERGLDDKVIDYFISNIKHANKNIAYYALNGLLEQAKIRFLSISQLRTIQNIFCDSEDSTVSFYLIEVLYHALTLRKGILNAAFIKNSTCRTLINIINKKHFDYSVKKNALNFLYFLSKEGTGFSWELINLTFNLIKSEEEIFASISLKIIQIQLQRFKDNLSLWQGNLLSFIEKIEQIVISKFFINNCLIRELLIIVNIIRHDYKCRLSDKLIDYLADIQLFNYKPYLSQYAFDMLKCLPKKWLTEKGNSIINLENAAKGLKIIGFSIKFYRKYLLLNYAEKYGYLTIRNYALLAELIATSKPNADVCLKISYNLACKQVKLPENLLLAIKNDVFQKNRESYNHLGLLILIEVGKYDRIITDEIFTLTFEKLKAKTITTETTLEVIELAAKNHIALSDIVVSFLLEILAEDDNSDLKSHVFRLLKEISSYKSISFLHFSKIINNFYKKTSEKDKENIVLTIISAMNHNPSLLTEKTGKKLVKLINSDILCPDIKLQLVDFFAKNHSQRLDFYNFHQLSHLLKLENTHYKNEEKIVVLSWLINANESLTQRIYNAVIILATKIVDRDEINALIDLFCNIKSYENWPVDLTEHLLKPTYSDKKLIGILLGKLANNSILFSEVALHFLYKLLTDNIQFSDDEFYKALEKINLYQPLNNTLITLLQLDKLNDCDGLLRYVEDTSEFLPKLPHKTISFIINLINKKYENAKLLRILYQYKALLTIEESESIVLLLIKTDVVFKNHENFYGFLLNKLKYETTILHRINEELYKYILSADFLILHLDYLNVLSQFQVLIPSRPIIEKLVFLTANRIEIDGDVFLPVTTLLKILRSETPNDFSCNADFFRLINLIFQKNKQYDANISQLLYFLSLQVKMEAGDETTEKICQLLKKSLNIKQEVLVEIEDYFTGNKKISVYLLLLNLNLFSKLEPNFGVPTVALHSPDSFCKGFICEAIILQASETQQIKQEEEKILFEMLNKIEIKSSFEDYSPVRDKFLLNILISKTEKKLSLKYINDTLNFIYLYDGCYVKALQWGEEYLIFQSLSVHFDSMKNDKNYTVIFFEAANLLNSLRVNSYITNILLEKILFKSSLQMFVNLLSHLNKLSVSPNDIEISLQKISLNLDKELAFYQFQTNLLDLMFKKFIQSVIDKTDQEKFDFLRFSLTSSTEKLLRNSWNFFKLYSFFARETDKHYVQ